MTTVDIHNTKRLAVTIGILLAGVALAGFISSLIETPQSEDAYLHDHLAVPGIKQDVKWEAVSFNLPPQDKRNIAQIIQKVESAASMSGLDTVLTGQALETARKAACLARKRRCNVPIRINRYLKTVHVNKDFRVANIKETSLRVDFQIKPGSTDVSLQGISKESRILRFYQTQGGWMHNSSEIIENEPVSVERPTDKFLTKFSKGFSGLNYYPASASWKGFWVDFPIDEIKSDLEKAQALNVNSLRIFLTHDYFDNADTREEAIAKLQTFLDLCEEKNIQVLITLFDLRPNYTLSNWTADIDHIDYALSKVANHKAILGIDLKNQPDLDFENWGEGLVEAWLTVMATHIQSNYSHLAVMTGWSKAKNATRLKDVFDVVTYHEYENPKAFDQRLNSIVSAAGDKPVMITELGSTTWHPPFIKSLGESSQASRLRSQLEQAGPAKGVFVWTLNDFDHVGGEVVGPLPWRQAQQRHFGLLRADGSLRPAATVLKTFGAHPKNDHLEHPFTTSTLTQNSTF